ncbi:MAG: preprotein translocase subunit SecE [Puniceicoccales bacterium]|jgi:preprotein translocase SecE subunit|nr:preprotein translocase subunit SecE [Puniceicoccales bacterium]
MNVLCKTGRFLSETADELKKTSWPTFAEFKRAVAVVLIGSLFLGAFVSAVDFSLFQASNLLIDVVR